MISCVSARIIIFYIFFYAFLAGFWSTCLYVFLQTLSSEEPRWYGKGSIIGNNPGALVVCSPVQILYVRAVDRFLL